MMTTELAISDSAKVITCVVPKGIAIEALKALRDRFGIEASNIHNARGVGRITPLRQRGIGEQSEKEVFSFVVDAERADEAFEFVFHEAHVDHAHGGIIYMSGVHYTSLFALPELPPED